jgi:hypothetical protein
VISPNESEPATNLATTIDDDKGLNGTHLMIVIAGKMKPLP